MTIITNIPPYLDRSKNEPASHITREQMYYRLHIRADSL